MRFRSLFRSLSLRAALFAAVSFAACGGRTDGILDGPGGEVGASSGDSSDLAQSGAVGGASRTAPAETGSVAAVSGAATGAVDASGSVGGSGSVAPSGASASGFAATSGAPIVVAISAAQSPPPSCAFAGPGVSDCGSNQESCCTSYAVPGGTYYRTYDSLNDYDQPALAPDGGPTGEADPASVSRFSLDKYNVTVGRFRPFVAAWKGGWLPTAGSGKHAHLNGGQGLASSQQPGSFEPGWVNSYDGYVALTDANLSCAGQYSSWTSGPGQNENLPIVCINWWEAYAFCIWDGGFLPSEAEWEYVAAGGGEQRAYPWGSEAPALGGDPSDLLAVGAAPLEAGLWGQLGLAGEVWQWSLDTYTGYSNPCVDCAYVSTSSSNQVYRGGGAGDCNTNWPGTAVPSFRCDYGGPAGNSGSQYGNSEYAGIGVRCARSPAP